MPFMFIFSLLINEYLLNGNTPFQVADELMINMTLIVSVK